METSSANSKENLASPNNVNNTNNNNSNNEQAKVNKENSAEKLWDETHFGKMGSWYINRTFFFDVHPPLGKMLIAFSGYLTGYNGTYPFEKPGDKYNGTRYEGMRYFCTTLGALIMPMAFDTVYDLTRSTEAAMVAASYLIFDVGMLTLNRYILLDPILLFFMTAAVWGMVKVSKLTKQSHSYTYQWWLWLIFTGTMLSATISVKFVGLFVVFLVGFHTVNELWLILGDLQKPITDCFKQLLSRALTLIIWPIILYMLFFYIHLVTLNRSGNGDGFYSSAFQSRLIGNSLYNASMPRKVAYGAVITIKNHKTGGGYLHSHHHLYPKGFGATQQQITTYTHKDDNNKWLIKPFNKEPGKEVRFVRNGDLIRLEHLVTKRNLHSHPELAPMTRKYLQVTGYGEDGKGDANDVWRLLVMGAKANETVMTVTTRFTLIHHLQNCVLVATGKQLPKWGFEQQEVSCNPNLRDKNGCWNVEDNKYKKLPNVNFSVYAPGFLARFLESHAVMLQVFLMNAIKQRRAAGRRHLQLQLQLAESKTPEADKIKEPELMKTLAQRANPRQEVDFFDAYTLKPALWLFLGWLIHYLPFWAMGRVLYFHHYFPALVFNSMLSGVMFHHLTGRLPRWLQHTLLGTLLSILVYSFTLFSPLAYGMNGPLANEPNSIMHGLRWLSSWEF
uniref:Protein O-mannosyl-transferase 2 n=1 Tax=Glossina palpalis gambiensis TaxID=67801 RepID=A0A1B0BB39_9MUSC